MKHSQILLVVVASLLNASLIIGEEASQVKQTVSAGGFTEYQLSNGMRVLLLPDPSKPVVTVNNTFFVGSRHEGYGEAGMAHLLEHMLFKGTPNHPNVPKSLQERGAQFNGTTWVDRTNYYETLPASDDNLEFAIQLEADRMINSNILGEDLKSEMTVVRNEFERGENSPSSVLNQRMMSAAFQWHNYGQATIGNRADIERVPVESLRKFYKKYYQPDNAMLIVSGKFDTTKALEYAQKYFGAIPRPERKLPQTYTEEPAQDGEKIVTLRRVGEVPLVGLLYHIPATAHPDYVAVDVLESILTTAPSGKLYRALVESKKASRISGVAFSWHDPGVLRLQATLNKNSSPQVALDTMLDEIQKVIDQGVTQEEVDRVKQKFRKQFDELMSDSRRLSLQMSEWAAMGDWRLLFLYRDRVKKVTPEDIQRVAASYLVESNRTVGMFIPTKRSARTKVPETPDLVDLFKDFKGEEAIVQGEAFDVSPDNIEKRTTRTKLSSGFKVALLPKKTRGEMVSLGMNLRFGNETNLQKLGKTCEFLGPLMIRGTKDLTRQQIQDKLDSLSARLNFNSSAGLLTITLTAKKRHFPEVIALLGTILREPSLPKEELEILKRSEAASLQQNLPDPSALAMKTISRKLNNFPKGDPRYVPTIQEEIDSLSEVTPDHVRKLHTDFLGGTHGELAIVGDFEAEPTLKLFETILSDWKPKQDYQRLQKTVGKKLPGEKIEINTPDKENATYYAAQLVKMSDAHPDYPALLIGNFILGGGSLSSRLGDRVRQQEGLSYGIGSFLQSRSLDERSAFAIFASTKPENAEKLYQVITEEIGKILESGITEEELAKAKTGYLQREEVSRTNDSRLARTLGNTLYQQRTMEYYQKLEQDIHALNVDVVNKALKQWIDPTGLITVLAGDFESKK